MNPPPSGALPGGANSPPTHSAFPYPPPIIPSPPAWLTADASLPEDTRSIGASRIGYSIPSAWVSSKPCQPPQHSSSLASPLVRAGLVMRWLQLDRERGEVKPSALEEHAGLPAALLGAEQQQRTLGVVGRGGADRAALRLDPQLLGFGLSRFISTRQRQRGGRSQASQLLGQLHRPQGRQETRATGHSPWFRQGAHPNWHSRRPRSSLR